LESFYTLHSATLQFFKAIDKTIQDILKKSNVGETVIKQLENVLPTLTKLKKEISKLDSETFAVGYKTKINQDATNIKSKMTLSEVNDTAQMFFCLLNNNKQTVIKERKDNEEQEDKKRKAEIEKRKQEDIEKKRRQKEIEQKKQQTIKNRRKELEEEIERLKKERKDDARGMIISLFLIIGILWLIPYFIDRHKTTKKIEKLEEELLKYK
jgi:Fe2+ transport system protein B